MTWYEIEQLTLHLAGLYGHTRAIFGHLRALYLLCVPQEWDWLDDVEL